MISCSKCNGRMFIDRQYSSMIHLEVYCLLCGFRKFYHPPTESKEGRWLLQRETSRARNTITPL